MSHATWLATRLNDTITRAAKSGLSSYGDPSYGSQTTFAGRADKHEGIVKLANGTEQNVSWLLITLTEVALSDRIWLPGDSTGDNTAARHPVMVRGNQTIDGADTVWEVFFS